MATRNQAAQLPIPSFFNPKNAGEWSYRPDQRALFEAAQGWKKQNGLKASATDQQHVDLYIIDGQKDFCFPEGTLYVGGESGTGAIDDSRRIAEFIYRNLRNISQVRATMDTHFAYQIFFSSFLVFDDGSPVPPHTAVPLDDVRSGKVKPSPYAAAVVGDYNYLVRHLLHYCSELEKAGKYVLYVWPEHCILGSDGHALAGVLHEARMFHAYTRGSQSHVEVKGGNPLTENYSVFRPEVLTGPDGKPIAQKNVRMYETALRGKGIFVGQAASHCVASSIDDILNEILAKDPKLASNFYVLEDCMSSVTVPDGKGGFIVNYTPQAKAALKRFSDNGMHVVKSTDPMETWPGFFD